MSPILVIGSTGHVGSQIVAQLVDNGVPVRAMTRNPGAARLPAQVQLVGGELTSPETLEPALNGVDSVFLVWTAPPAAFPEVLERIARRARRIVYLSAPLKTPHPFFQQPNATRVVAERIERSIEGSGLEWTFLRPGMFACNAPHWWGQQLRAGDLVRWPYLDVPTAPIDPRDIAAIGVRALCEDGHAGAEYVLTGPESLTQREQISIVGSVLGRRLRIEEMTADEARKELVGVMDWGMVPATSVAAVIEKLLSAWCAAAGLPAFVSTTFAEITGTRPRTFRQWVGDHAGDFPGTSIRSVPGERQESGGPGRDVRG
jgi:uncharacterized protein YbjT (DUF2867 family)